MSEATTTVPAPPLRVLAKPKPRRGAKGVIPEPRWYIVFMRYDGSVWLKSEFGLVHEPKNMIVVDHPRNDPEAVELARKGGAK